MWGTKLQQLRSLKRDILKVDGKFRERSKNTLFEEKFKPLKNELMQEIRNRLINALADPKKVCNFEGVSKEQISKEITKIIKSNT